MILSGYLKAIARFANQSEAEAGVLDDVVCSPLNVAQAIAANPSTGGLEKTVVGAVGDGVADDTSALQAALSSLDHYEVLNGQGKHFKISSTLIIPAKRNHKFYNCSITVVGDIECMRGDSAAPTYSNFFHLENMFITAHEHTTTGRKLIDYTRMTDFRFKDVFTWGTSGKTIHYYGTGNAGYGPYYGNWNGCSGLNGYAGIYMENVSPALGVNSNQIFGGRMAMGSGGVGLYIGNNSQNIAVYGMTFEHPTGGTGIYDRGDATFISGCRFEALTVGINDGNAATVIGCYFDGCVTNRA